ncbi:MAG: glycosyltransferase family 4 protein [Oceanococcus sp.]
MPDKKPVLLYVIKFTLVGGAQLHLLQLIRHFSSTYDVHLCVGQFDHVAEVAAKEGTTIHHLPLMESDASLPMFFRLIGELRRLVRQLSPDLVHVHSPLAGVACRWACWAEKVPCVTTIHSWNFAPGMPWTRRVSSWVLEFLVSRLRQPIIAVSEFDSNLGQKYGVAAPPQVQVIHNGIEDVQAPYIEGVDNGKIRVVMVSRFDVRKCQDQLIRAIHKIEGPWQLVLAGDGPSRTAFEQLTNELGIRDRVEFLGNVTDVPGLLKTCDVGVLISQAEGLPLAILEQIRQGLPVIATDVGGVAEAVRHNETGYLVPMNNLTELSARLELLLRSNELRKKFGKKGRELYLKQFGERAMLEKTGAIYQCLAQ